LESIPVLIKSRLSRLANPGDEFEPEGFIRKALQQSALKPFEPLDELLELKLSFLWVLLFAPILPLGVIPTLAARLVECHSDLSKLLFVRRRTFPAAAQVCHATQKTFVAGSCIFAALWSVGLSLITYNDDLYLWIE